MKFENNNLKIGELGEFLASRYLEELGFKVVERNYKKPWGEIDIIAEKKIKNKANRFILTNFSPEIIPILHFVEVKSVSCETLSKNISHETDFAFQPEDNIHRQKIQRLQRAIQSYVNGCGHENLEWQFDIIALWIDVNTRKAKIKFVEDIPI